MPPPTPRALPALFLLAATCLLPPTAAFCAARAPGVTVYAAGDIARCAHPDPAWSGAAATAALVGAELAMHPARCTLAYWHHPLYSSGMNRNISRMKDAWQALYDAGAELVLSGHDHVYERFAPQDAEGRRDDARSIRQFVVGTGGAIRAPFLWPHRNSEARDSNHFGVLKLVLGEDGYESEFLEVPDGASGAGKRPDRGAGRCH